MLGVDTDLADTAPSPLLPSFSPSPGEGTTELPPNPEGIGSSLGGREQSLSFFSLSLDTPPTIPNATSDPCGDSRLLRREPL